MADITRTFEVPNRVPGKLVFGPKRILATFGSTETNTPSPPASTTPGGGIGLPPIFTPSAGGVQAGQAICGLTLDVGTSKELIAFDSFADDNLSVGTSIEVSDP